MLAGNWIWSSTKRRRFKKLLYRLGDWLPFKNLHLDHWASTRAGKMYHLKRFVSVLLIHAITKVGIAYIGICYNFVRRSPCEQRT